MYSRDVIVMPGSDAVESPAAYVHVLSALWPQCEHYARFRGWMPQQCQPCEGIQASVDALDSAGEGGLIVWDAGDLDNAGGVLHVSQRGRDAGWGVVVASFGLDTSLPAGAAALGLLADVAVSKGHMVPAPPGLCDFVKEKRGEGWPWWRIVETVNNRFPAPMSGKKWTQANVQSAVGRL